MFAATLFIRGSDGGGPMFPPWQMDKLILSSNERTELQPLTATWMDLGNLLLKKAGTEKQVLCESV